ncbi:hypothetical protein CVT25_002802 [Psilocybe cyanescens]|uniref:Uncharacterized protein n=1 Tax=Psilocybe cyanescens TaxID=93625 RepID=A0A409WKX7_PSICY|nr:hypothetical protein CVT25_002802 [Psilocybe cyanescens]
MILDDKIIMFPPPPPYLQSQSPPSPSSSSAHFSARPHATLTSLPSHILLQIIHHTFPPLTSPSHTPLPSPSHQYQQLYQDTKPERQRKTLFWLSTALRLVSRQLYTACMHVLRSTYLPSYSLLVRPPYTSDPFPLSLPTSASSTSSGATAPHESAAAAAPPAYSSSRSTASLTSLAHAQPQDTQSPLLTIHRETPVLDRFIALKVRQDVFADDTELHTDREDAFRDLFDVAQPRARLEDLVRVYGVREGVVSVPGTGGGGGAARQGQGQGREEREGQGRVYTNTSQNSSLVSLPSPKSPPPPPFSPSSSSHPTPVPAPAHTVKPRRSIFSFMKGAPSSPTAAAAAAAQNSRPLPPPPRQPQPHIQPMPFSALSVSFSPRRVGLVLNRSRTIAEVPRLGMGRNKEPLEALARALVGELRVALGG